MLPPFDHNQEHPHHQPQQQQEQQSLIYQQGDHAHRQGSQLQPPYPSLQQQQQQQQQQKQMNYMHPNQQQHQQSNQQQHYQQQQQYHQRDDYYRQDHGQPSSNQQQQPMQRQIMNDNNFSSNHNSNGNNGSGNYNNGNNSNVNYSSVNYNIDNYNNNSSFQQQPQQHRQGSKGLSSDPMREGTRSTSGASAASPTGRRATSEYASTSSASMSHSVEASGSSSPRSESESSLRFKVTLEAQTAALQRQGETPVTYLNKGQFYTMILQDLEEHDGEIQSVIRVAFHEEAHRKMAARYWSFWLSQAPNPKAARAVDIENTSSSELMEVQSRTFDRISFKWNGKAGANLVVRFNCLSTDFSRIKGVKGIPLRVHMDTMVNDIEQTLEHSYSKIKLFRDKGAERKNKDDQKHLEKMWDKMRGKSADTNPLFKVLAPVQLVSVFWECHDYQEYSAEDAALDLTETLELESEGDGGAQDTAKGDEEDDTNSGLGIDDSDAPSSTTVDVGSKALVPASRKRSRTNETGGRGTGGNDPALGDVIRYGAHDSSTPSSLTEQTLDKDPNYVPQMRKRKQPLLCLYIKIGGEKVYRAVYLEQQTLSELVQKVSEKLEIQSSSIAGMFRKTKKDILVQMDDGMVAQMTDELDFVVDYDFNQLDGSVNLTLKY